MTATSPSPLLPALLCLQLAHMASAVSDDATTATFKTIFDSSDGMDINGVILAVGALLVGALLVVAGYRLWQTTVYAMGFLGGGVVIAVIFEKVFKSETWVLTASWIALVVGGIVVGYACVYLFQLGIAMAGAVAGAALAILVNTSFGYEFAPSHPATVLIVLTALFAVVGAVLALWLQKPVLVAATSLVGAFLVFWGAGYFIGNYPTFNDLERFRVYSSSGELGYSIPGAWWGYLIGTLVLSALSTVFQLRVSGKDVEYHTLDRRYRGSEDELPRQAGFTPTRVQYDNMGTPGVQPQYQQQRFQEQRYPTSNQVQWEDLQAQQPTHQQRPQPSQRSYVDTSLVRPQYQQREHDYQISDIVPSTARPQDPGTPPPVPSAPTHPSTYVV